MATGGREEEEIGEKHGQRFFKISNRLKSGIDQKI